MKKPAFLFILLYFAASHAQSQKFDTIINRFRTQKNFSGVALVATNGTIDFLGAAGMADHERGVKVDTRSKFRIASMTKVFTALLVMKLEQQGLIGLNNKIGDYFRDYKGEGKDKVTIHHLLTYSSGIENQANPLGIEPYEKKMTLDAYINRYCSGPLVYTPGEKSVYGNTEYIILQKIIENVSGKSYQALLKENILVPLRMNNTGIASSDREMKGSVKTYTYNESQKTFANDPPLAIENYFGAGSLYSTAEDMLKLSNALFGNKILSEATTSKMLTINDKLGNTAYGLWGSDGWALSTKNFTTVRAAFSAQPRTGLRL